MTLLRTWARNNQKQILRRNLHKKSSPSPITGVAAIRTLSGLPGDRLPSFRRALENRDFVEGTPYLRPLRILETHSGLSSFIADHIKCTTTNREYDGMWSSSLTASAVRGMPDIEAVDVATRLDIVRESLSVTTKPMVFDADSGGEKEIFKFTVRDLEQLGVSAAIIEDKAGLKQNSLFGTDRKQTLADLDEFCAKIKAGGDAKKHPDFMIIARMESLIAGYGVEEALKRAVASTDAGADGILIHSKSKTPAEIQEFVEKYRNYMGKEYALPIVAVPSTYSSTTEKELAEMGIDVCIYANQMLRAAYPAMVKAAGSILSNTRAHECEDIILPVKNIIRLFDNDEGASKPVSEEIAELAFEKPDKVVEPKKEDVPQRRFIANVTKRSKNNIPFFPSGTYLNAYLNEVNGVKSFVVQPAMVRSESTLVQPWVESNMQLDPSKIIEFLQCELGVNFFVGVPDSCLKHFCAQIDTVVGSDENAAKHVISANEGASIAMATGYYLASGNTPLVYMQNSGLGNAINPLTSLAHTEVYGIPMVMLIGWRGCPDGDPDEPQHTVAGRQMMDMLSAAGVDTLVLSEDEDDAKAILSEAFEIAKERSGPVAVLVRPKTFAEGESASSSSPSPSTSASPVLSPSDLPSREESISTILDSVGPSDVIVSTTGFTSRELYEIRESRGEARNGDFLCVGSMGHAVAIAQGIAMESPDRTVWCLDGDGAALMHLGSLVSTPTLGLPNFRHVLFNNFVHESVGGQPTSISQGAAASGDQSVSFAEVARVSGYASSNVVHSARELSSQLRKLRSTAGPSFIEIQTRQGAREGLGRPKHSTLDAMRDFRAFMDSPVEEAEGTLQDTKKNYPPLPQDGLLLTPGPLTTSEQTKLAMVHDFGSRDRRFVQLTSKVRSDIVDIFPGENPDLTAVLLQGSGTFAVEAMLAQFVPKDPSEGKLVILSNGAYGRRMAEICESIGRSYVIYESPEDAPLDTASVDSFLQSEEARDATHVAVIHCETTTGVINPLPEISQIVSSSGKKLLVDAMSAFGVVEVDPSEVKFEALAASSNKGLQGPPGVGVVVCSRVGLEESAGNAGALTLDLHAQWRAFEATGEWRFTPPTHVMLGLSQALNEFNEEGGTEGRHVRYAANCNILVQGMRRLGFETLLADDVQAPVIVTFLLPSDPNFDFQQFYDLLSDRGFVIYPGKVATKPTFRVGCIGDVYPADMHHFLEVVEETMDEMNVRSGNP